MNIPLGNLVGGAFRAQAYIMEASSSQVPCTLPQSLERQSIRIIQCNNNDNDNDNDNNNNTVNHMSVSLTKTEKCDTIDNIIILILSSVLKSEFMWRNMFAHHSADTKQTSNIIINLESCVRSPKECNKAFK